MAGRSPSFTLDLWERAQHLTPIERAVALAAAAEPAAPREDVAVLPLGRRDARLLRLRGASARPTLDATATCPSCGESIEFAPEAAQLLSGQAGRPPEPVRAAGFVVRWRPPTSADMAAAAAAGDPEAARATLLERCVLAASGPDGAVSVHELPPAVHAALDDAMAAADPLAEVLIDLACPACAAAFVADLDVAGFVWSELEAGVRRLLGDVDALARAYGWTEPEVLALSDERRAAYLRLARAGAA